MILARKKRMREQEVMRERSRSLIGIVVMFVQESNKRVWRVGVKEGRRERGRRRKNAEEQVELGEGRMEGWVGLFRSRFASPHMICTSLPPHSSTSPTHSSASITTGTKMLVVRAVLRVSEDVFNVR